MRVLITIFIGLILAISSAGQHVLRDHLVHDGLFLDRLDVGIVTGIGGSESPRLVPDLPPRN